MSGNAFVTLVYIPSGGSEPAERQAYLDDHNLDELVDLIIANTWDAGHEPLEVRDQRGLVLWTSTFFGDLS